MNRIPPLEDQIELFRLTKLRLTRLQKSFKQQHEISDPAAIDNEHKLREAFHNENGYVPAYYLFDSSHKLKSFAAGEYGVKVIEPALERSEQN